MTTQLLIASGALAGLGVTLIVRELLPAQPDLTDALDRIHGRDLGFAQPQTSATAAASRRAFFNRTGRRVSDEVQRRRVFPLPLGDLALLGRPVERFLLTKLGLGLLGLAFPHLLSAVVASMGMRLPLAIPLIGSLVLAAGLFLVPDVDVRTRARAARAELRRAVCAYLDLVALERAGDAGVIESMERAAAIGHGWAFIRIHDTLLRARLDRVAPWAALHGLTEELDIPELGDVADIMRLSGEDGAAVYDTLRARAQSLRTTILTQHEARANSDSEKMVAPVAFLGIVFIALLGYPALARIVFG